MHGRKPLIRISLNAHEPLLVLKDWYIMFSGNAFSFSFISSNIEKDVQIHYTFMFIIVTSFVDIYSTGHCVTWNVQEYSRQHRF
jgi:hypothetical protein